MRYFIFLLYNIMDLRWSRVGCLRNTRHENFSNFLAMTNYLVLRHCVRFIGVSEIPYYGLPRMLRILATTKSRLPRHCERSVAVHNQA
ncbi:hypothetical protein [Helicobacter rodentium]|uniref:hypothetical protein n=1 Tax=Helicobacter rodentium TaxID=59617 RepID=UPI0023F2ACCF|nr:hypothetical protein [Helicobacter rodentium]